MSKNKPNYYFVQDTEDAIIEYNTTTDLNVRNKIFKDRIEKPLYKLAEFKINQYRAYNLADTFEGCQHLVIDHLLKILDRFDTSRGRAFSYLTYSTNTFIWNEVRKVNKQNVKHIELTVDVIQNDSEYDDHERRDFFHNVILYLDENIFQLFERKEEILIVEGFLVLLKRYQNLEILNKKALYLQIREICKLDKSTLITSVVYKLKQIFEHLLKKYQQDGFFDMTYLCDVNELIVKSKMKVK